MNRASFAVGMIGAIVLAGEEPRVEVTPRLRQRHSTRADSIRVDVKLTLIPVTVTDPLGAPFSGLQQDAFQLLEDGVPQHVKYFGTDDAPVSLGVIFDASRSMEGKLKQSREAVGRFFNTTRPGDEYFLVSFNDTPRLLANFTTDTESIARTLIGIEPKSWTALFDAVYLGIRQMKQARNPRKALLLLSDGADNYSRYTEHEMKSLVREADVCIYSLGLLGGGLIQRHARMLRNLSEETGGRLYHVQKISDLPAAVAKVSAAIRNQYLLGYSSANADNNGLYRKIEVRLNQAPGLPPLRASWRAGYYAPDDR